MRPATHSTPDALEASPVLGGVGQIPAAQPLELRSALSRIERGQQRFEAHCRARVSPASSEARQRDTERAMSQENVEVIRAVYDRFSEGDFRASADLLDPYVVLVLSPEFAPALTSAHGGVLYGVEAVADYTRSLLEVMTDFTMEAKDIVAAGESVLVDVHQRAVGRTSGVPTEVGYFTLWTFRGPKVIRIESFGERADALEAAGLSE
jgi:ketosteroid isomerase-like protein